MELRPLLHHDRLFCFLAVFIFTLMVFSFDSYTIDDAFISYRYAKNLSDGYGLVFNREAAPVEGFSNFLWTIILAGVASVKFDLPSAGKVLSIFFGYLVIIMTGLWARFQKTDNPAISASLPMLILAVWPSLSLWSISGMEMTFFLFLLISGSVVILIEERLELHGILSAVLLSAATLTRPEGIAFALLICLGAYVENGSHKLRIVALVERLLIILIIFIVFLLWRKTYFGDWLPNTFYAKTGSLADSLPLGVEYLLGFLKVGGGVLILLLLFSFLIRPRISGLATLLIMSAGYIGYILMIGGDWMPGHRLFLPLIPFLALVASLLIARFSIHFRGFSILMIWIVLTAVSIPGFKVNYPYMKGSTIRQLVLGESRKIDYLKDLGLHLKNTADPYALIAVVPAGKVPFYSELRTIDMRGLCDSHIARSSSSKSSAMIAGHFKRDPEYVLNQKPDYVVTSGSFSKSLSGSGPSLNQKTLLLDSWEILQMPEFKACYKEIIIELDHSDKNLMYYERYCD